MVKSKLGCRFPKRTAKETHYGVTYTIGSAIYSIPSERIGIKSGRIQKSVSMLLKANPTLKDLEKLKKLGVTCTKIS